MYLGTSALCHILLCVRHHEVVNSSLKEGWEANEVAGVGACSLVQKDSFFQIAYKNRMDVGGEGTARGRAEARL